MFGDVTFAQTPFAALGGATFASSLSESATASDSVFAPSVIRGGIQAETATGTDSVVNLNNTLTASSFETAAAAETQAVIANMLASQAEAATATDAQTAVGTMLAVQSELATAVDAQFVIATLLAAAIIIGMVVSSC